MRPEMDSTWKLIEEILQKLSQTKGDECARQVRSIVLANFDRGRLQDVLSSKDADRLQAYIWNVAQTFSTLQPYLHQLQIEQNTEAWEPLFERMQTWAYNYFLRKGFVADDNTREIAIERATEAAISILHAHFPYDTEFDPWAHIIVQNACRKYIHKAFKKSAIPENKKVELQDGIVDPTETLLEFSTLQKELGEEILEALSQLSEARRTVIQLVYFEELEPDEIAQKMNKSVGAIYSLQFNALKDLRKILGTNRDNINEAK